MGYEQSRTGEQWNVFKVLSEINEWQSSGSCLEEFTKEQKVIFLSFTRELDYLAI